MVSGRGKARNLYKKEIRVQKTLVFWVYDFRRKADENIWDFLTKRHNDCIFEEKIVHQILAPPFLRMCFFKCFNCTHPNCFWKDAGPEFFNRKYSYPNENSIKWIDDSDDYF